jgi:hypothetical protein
LARSGGLDGSVSRDGHEPVLLDARAMRLGRSFCAQGVTGRMVLVAAVPGCPDKGRPLWAVRLGVLVQSILARHWVVVGVSAVGLLAMAFAPVAGTGFTSTGDNSASMVMSVLTGVALLCYAANLYVLRLADRGGQAARYLRRRLCAGQQRRPPTWRGSW